MNNFKQSFFAGLFSVITIGVLTLLTYKTDFGIFLIASFGSSMVLLYGYPESPFAQPKNVFFGHLLTAVVGMIFLYLVPLPLYIILPLAVNSQEVSLGQLSSFIATLSRVSIESLQATSIYNRCTTTIINIS